MSGKLDLVEGEQERIKRRISGTLHQYLVIFNNVQPSKNKDTGDRVQEI